MEYADIHIHLLAGMDDGAKDIETTKKMLEQARRQNITRIIATPHGYPGIHQYNLVRLMERYGQTRTIAHEMGIELYLGTENFYHDGLVGELDRGRVLTMANSSYVLVEFSPDDVYTSIYNAVRKLTQAGYKPILAHIERYQAIVRDKSKRDELRKLGARFQINGRSLLGGMFDSQARNCLQMIKDGEIAYIGSDAHDLKVRNIPFAEVVQKLTGKIPDETIQKLLWENPGKIIEAGKKVQKGTSK